MLHLFFISRFPDVVINVHDHQKFAKNSIFFFNLLLSMGFEIFLRHSDLLNKQEKHMLQ